MATLYTLFVLLFSLVVHEVSHGLMALSLGDKTAKEQGRLSLNPLKHLDLFGSVLFPLLLYLTTFGQGPLFGWAKPVPVNPNNFSDRKKGMLKVALAGPLANFSVAVFLGLWLRFLPLPVSFSSLLGIVVLYNLLWGFFNLLPFPPLDGSQILFSVLPEFSRLRAFLSRWGMFLLLLFIFFGFRFLGILVFGVYQLLVG